MMKEPTRSVKAVLLPSWMAPKAVQRIAIRRCLGGEFLKEAKGGDGEEGWKRKERYERGRENKMERLVRVTKGEGGNGNE